MKITNKDCYDSTNEEALKREDGVIRVLALTFTGMLRELEKVYGEGVVDVARKGFLEAKIGADKQTFATIKDKTLTNYCTWLNSILHLTQEFEVELDEEKQEARYTFHYCPWAKYFNEFGGAKYGHFFCDADEPMAREYDPSLGFTITQRLMDGDCCCDHFLYIKKEHDQE